MILKYENYQLGAVSVFERVRFQAPFKPSVTYEQEACFIYSLSGNGMLFGGLERDRVEAGESILMKCGSFLNHWNSARDREYCEIIAIHVTPAILSEIYEGKVPRFLVGDQRPNSRIFQKITQTAIIDEYIKGLVFYFDHPTLVNEALIVLKLKELILLLYNINYEGLEEMLRSLFDPVEISFKSIVETHLFECLSIREYAALTNTSLATFKRRFKKIFNDTPANYLTSKRLEKASQLLRITDKRITTICLECGFNDLATFSRAFSKRYAQSPSSYRSAS